MIRRRTFFALLVGLLLVGGALAEPRGQTRKTDGLVCNAHENNSGMPTSRSGQKKLEQIVSAARARTAALIDRDGRALRRLLGVHFAYTNASGKVFGRDGYIKNYALDKTVVWTSQTLSDVCVRFAGDVAILTAVTHDIARFGDYSLNSRFRTTQVYRQIRSNWIYIAGHTSNQE